MVLKKKLGKVDITKPEVSLKWFAVAVLAITVLVLAFSVGKFLASKIESLGKGAIGDLSDLERELRIR